MIDHCIRYTIDPHMAEGVEAYAHRWMNGIIRRCDGEPFGYFLPKRGFSGSNNAAFALIGFENPAAYESYRGQLLADHEVQENFALADKSRCILVGERPYFKWIGEDGRSSSTNAH